MRSGAGALLAAVLLAGCGRAPEAAAVPLGFPALLAPPAGAACVLVRPRQGGAQDCLIPASDPSFRGRKVFARGPAWYYPSVPGLALELEATDNGPEHPGVWAAFVRLDVDSRVVMALRFLPRSLGAGASVQGLGPAQWKRLFAGLETREPFRPPVEIKGF